MRECSVEVEPVGEVEVGFEVQRPGVVDVLVVQRRVAGVDVQVPVKGVSCRVRGGEVERS